ncbi:hypothetical protein C8J57DRAFT_1226136 [Mycena rebaudengoi]|nr:hypothetical protein C8J57DRAFT_1226132 [Mycena rebaudengoi]KAJ7271551.1 hypothetical protein C8J57DRAFT_1226136 [Mycena rebaudengoi]
MAKLDRFFDTKAAVQVLEDAIKESSSLLREDDDHALQHLKDINVEHLTVQSTGAKKKTWCLGPNAAEELVIRMQGIVSKLDLQPGSAKRFDVKSAVNLSQSLEIVGMGGPAFEQCINSTKSIHQFYEQNFVGVNMSKWDVKDATYGSRLKFSTRFFTSNHEDPTVVAVPFGPGVDLLGALTKFEGTHLVHGSDNVVRYYRKSVDPKTQETVYDGTFPGSFRVGDVVEVHGSLVTFTTKKGKEMRMHFTLQSVTLIDGEFSKAASWERNKEDSVGVVQTSAMRRKAPYAPDDTLAATQKKFKSLAVTDANK